MSYRHIKLKTIPSNGGIVKYSIECPDFSENFQVENFGIIELYIKNKSFIHKKNQLWNSYKIYPIHLFEFSFDERVKEIEKNYSNYGGGAWAIAILDFIQDCFKNNHFPHEQDLVG